VSPIRNTVLFKSLLSSYPTDQRDAVEVELELALADAAASTHVDFSAASPDSAVSWSQTPQGIHYWRAHFERCLAARR
jgi:hypothetical protein